MVAQVGDVELRPHPGADGLDQVGDLLVGEDTAELGPFHVQHLAAQRQDGLAVAVAPLL